MPSSTTARPRRSAGAGSRRKGRKSGGRGWISLLPLLLCLAVTPLAVRSASILALEGPKAFALLYPWVEVLRSPALRLGDALAGTLSQWAMYLQFPLYGLLMTLTFRTDKPQRALMAGVAAHFAGLLLAVGLAFWVQAG